MYIYFLLYRTETCYPAILLPDYKLLVWLAPKLPFSSSSYLGLKLKLVYWPSHNDSTILHRASVSLGLSVWPDTGSKLRTPPSLVSTSDSLANQTTLASQFGNLN